CSSKLEMAEADAELTTESSVTTLSSRILLFTTAAAANLSVWSIGAYPTRRTTTRWSPTGTSGKWNTPWSSVRVARSSSGSETSAPGIGRSVVSESTTPLNKVTAGRRSSVIPTIAKPTCGGTVTSTGGAATLSECTPTRTATPSGTPQR